MGDKKIDCICLEGINRGASDVHITVGRPVMFRINGELVAHDDKTLKGGDVKELLYSTLDDEQIKYFNKEGDIDYSYTIESKGRFRVNAYKQRGSFAMVMRIIPLKVPSIDDLKLPEVVKDLTKLERGLVLITGPTGSGKSATLAAMVNEINNSRSGNIITLEDPIEYLHKHNKSLVNQREIGEDCKSFGKALESSLRQDPDVILVGEMRDLETISTAITAAETGHLVISTLHTLGATKTIDRVIDVFPPHQQQQVKVQMGSVLEAVISQQLVVKSDGTGMVGAFEVMIATNAVRSLVREGKVHQIDSVIETGGENKMQTMDADLARLYNKGVIDKDVAISKSINKDSVERYMREESNDKTKQIWYN